MSNDPTAFDIRFDPLTQRMSGHAIHGNTPFDVQFVSPVTPNLWVGGCEGGLVLPKEVQHLVSLYPWEEYRVKHDILSKMSVRQYDSNEGPDEEELVALARWVDCCMRTGVTLVHCQAGLNRSSRVAALALMAGGMMAAEAVNLLRAKRSPAVLCNRSFERWLYDRGSDALAGR
jgi:protein-tyrosine phosphatase